MTVLIILIFLSLEVTNYLNYYSKVYPVKEAIEWQYGMKEIVEFSEKNLYFYRVYVDKLDSNHISFSYTT